MIIRRLLRWTFAALTFVILSGATGYAFYVRSAYERYGTPEPAPLEDYDALLQQYMPTYDVVERHRVVMDAPADLTFNAAVSQDLLQVPAVRAIFRAREVLLRATPTGEAFPRGVLASTQAMGWVVLAEEPGREVVVGAVTKPWQADVTFRSIPPEQFAAFNEPGYVKIVWTLRADPLTDATAVFRTETRALATDAEARRKFRRYWSFLSPGIILIRHFSAAQLQAELRKSGSHPVSQSAERR